MKKVVAFGVAKRVFDEARKPENQARLKQVADEVKARRNRGQAR